MKTRTYWKLHPRKFANEYTIGIATTTKDAEQYEAEGYKRINRDAALGYLSYRPPSHEQLYRTVTIDGVVPQIVQCGESDVYQIARNIRTGLALESASR